MENPIELDDLGIPLFLETPILNFGGVQPMTCHDMFRPRHGCCAIRIKSGSLQNSGAVGHHCLDVPLEVRINGLFHLFINGVYWGYNPLILTIAPNFLGHPSGEFKSQSKCTSETSIFLNPKNGGLEDFPFQLGDV